MVTYFNKKDIVEFGNYLFSEEREKSFIHTSAQAMTDGIEFNSSWERLRTVTDADIENWMESKRKPIRKAAPKIEAPQWLIDHMATAPKELQEYVIKVFPKRDERCNFRTTISGSLPRSETPYDFEFWYFFDRQIWKHALEKLHKKNLL